MQMRALGPAAGWRWLMQGINLGRNDPKALFGAAAFLLGAALVPTLLQVALEVGFELTGEAVAATLLALTLLYSLLVMPPLMGGLLRVIDAVENGRPTRATAIFDAFRTGGGARRMVLLALVMFAILAALLAVIVWAFGDGVVDWYFKAAAALQSAAPGKPPSLPPLPSGFGTVLALVVLVGLFFQGAQAISLGQVALTRRSVGGALADGFRGALKNLLPLVVLMVAAFIGMVLAAIVFGLLVTLLTAVGQIIHPALGIALAAPVNFAFLLMVYVVVFGVMYHLWRDVAGGIDPDAGHHVVAA